VVIDRGKIRKRSKKPSKPFRDTFGHTPLSVKEKIPWKRAPRPMLGRIVGSINFVARRARSRERTAYAGRAAGNYRVSPGDDTIHEPYAYVGRWNPRR
jgi:hypothetical protein